MNPILHKFIVFCRPQCDINDFIGTTNEENGKDKERYRQASSTASASDQPKSQDLSDVPESMGLLINSPPPNKCTYILLV